MKLDSLTSIVYSTSSGSSCRQSEPRVWSRSESLPGSSASTYMLQPAQSSSAGEHEQRATSVSHTVLVVDDDEIIRQLLERLLRIRGHKVLTATNGPEALALLNEHRVDLAMIDLMMPGMSGAEVLQHIKVNPALHDLPVIVVSADSDVDTIVSCLTLGAEDYLVKPFNTVFFDARVGACLERQRLRAQEQAYRLELEARVSERTAELAHSEAQLRRQSAILQSILDSMGDGVVVVDSDGRLVHHNPAAPEILGDSFAGLIPHIAPAGSPFRHRDQITVCPPEQLPLARAINGQAVDGMELFVSPSDERPGQWLSITARPFREPGGVHSGGVAVIRNISAAKQNELALRDSEERYALAARGANDGLWDWDLCTQQIYFSPRWKQMLGYGEDAIGTTTDEWFLRVHPEDREGLSARLIAHHRRMTDLFEHEYRIQHKDGTYRWMLCRGLAVWNTEGYALRMAGSQTDITDRKLVEQQLLHDALHDGLTGLPNRALFVDRLDHAIMRKQRSPEYNFAVLFLDLDRFKVINDSLGHAIGDELLIAITRRLESCLRPVDTVARLGGDEFTILLEDIPDSDAALSVAERIQATLAVPLRLGTHDVFSTASIGVVLSSALYDSPTDMIRDADTAMYHAKVSGKARAVLFNPSMHDQAISLLQLESDLRRAIERDELRVHYQPIVALDSGLIVGLEALVRWQHPQRGLLYPADFLGIAEETGLIVPLGWWVMREACQQLRVWQNIIPAAANMWVNVNLSEKQLAQPDVIDQIMRTLAVTGLSPRSLKLEITEHALLAHGNLMTTIFTQIREAGVQLCIDDFGTGYSSLSYLQRFPVDVLKIDRSFISQLGEQSEIVRTIIALARALSLQAVAEGTETVEQVDQLRALDCEYGQGWLFSKALDADRMEALIRAEQTLL